MCPWRAVDPARRTWIRGRGADNDPALLETFLQTAAARGVTVTAWHLDIQRGLPERGTFDGVVCTEVLEHVPDYRRAMNEIAQALKPGGRACISVPTAGPEVLYRAPRRAHRSTQLRVERVLAVALRCTFAVRLHGPGFGP